MYHRYPYVSFAEFSEERIRGDSRGASNKRADIEGQQRKESVVSNKRVSLSQAAKYQRSRNKQTRSQDLDCHLLFSIVNRLIVDCILILYLLLNYFC